MSISSVIRYTRALDSSATDGSGKTGLAFGDITAKYLTQGGTLTSLTTETITTLGTYQAPSDAAHIRIKELNSGDPTKGVYEIHFHNTQVASTGLKLWLFLSATGAAFQPLELDLADLSGRLPAALTSDGNIKADTLRVSGTTQTARDLGNALPAAAPNANGGLPILSSSGTTLGYTVTTVTTTITATNLTNAPTNGDFTTAMKTSLNAATPAVTVSDKTGFSLANGSFVTATFGTCDFTSAMKTSLNAATPASIQSVTNIVSAGAINTSSGAVSTVTTVANQLTADTIAAAVRDVDNGSPASGSFGQAARNADAKAAILIDTIGTPANVTVSADLVAINTNVLTRSTYAGGDTSGTTTLLTRVTAAVATASALATLQTTASTINTNVGTAGAGLTAVGDARLANLDVAVSSRSTYAGGDTSGTTTLLTRVTAAVALAGSAPSWYTAPVDVSSNVTSIKAKTDNLPASPAAVGSAMALQDGAITDTKITLPTEATGTPSTFLQLMMWVAGMLGWRKVVKDASNITQYMSNSTTAKTTSSYTSGVSTDTINKAS